MNTLDSCRKFGREMRDAVRMKEPPRRERFCQLAMASVFEIFDKLGVRASFGWEDEKDRGIMSHPSFTLEFSLALWPSPYFFYTLPATTIRTVEGPFETPAQDVYVEWEVLAERPEELVGALSDAHEPYNRLRAHTTRDTRVTFAKIEISDLKESTPECS